MSTIPDYPAPSRALTGEEPLAAWQDGQQIALPVSAVLNAAKVAVQPLADEAEASAEAAAASAARIVLDVAVTMGENGTAGTNYIVTEPDGVYLDQDGLKFTFVVPATNVSDTNAYISIMRGDVLVQASVIRMVIGQKLRGGFRAEFTNNKTNANFKLDRQSPDALTYFDLEDRVIPFFSSGPGRDQRS